ncbi:MAG: hypothetical protein N2Z75_00030 [Meiothermus sp.]|nr:hypothetical protein [Meiothermus sp.]
MEQPPPEFVSRDWCIHDPVSWPSSRLRGLGLDPADDPELYYWNGWLWVREYPSGEFRALTPVDESELDRDVQKRLQRWRESGMLPLDENDPEQVERAKAEWRKRVWAAPNPW